MKRKNVRFNDKISVFYFILTACVLACVAGGCGGGGGGAAGAPGADPASGDSPTLRTALKLTNQTYYLPSETQWVIFDATAADTWFSAIGNSSGLSASMTNPFTEVGVWIMPKDNYSNPGTVEFYIDGALAGTLDLSQETPYEGYSDEFVTYYQVADDLADTTHTITMVIATGTVAFDGWRMVYKNLVYDIDCSDANRLERDAIAEVNKIRNAIEAYAQDYGGYPNPGTEPIHEFLDSATNSYFTSEVTNVFTDEPIAATTTFSAGDYMYTYNSASDYTLEVWGGRDVIYTVTANSATTDQLTLTLTSPTNHLTTASSTVTFTGTASTGGNLTVSGIISGYTSFPSAGAFTTDMVLSEGLEHYTVKLTDPYGNYVDLIRSITKDTTAPTIGINAPFPVIIQGNTRTATVNTSPYTLKGYSDPLATVTVNGAAVTLDSIGVFTQSLTLQQGNNTVTIVATDAFNNQNTYTLTLVYAP